MKYNNKRGFTLIELLVVIAIICIIAAVLFPVFASAREKGRQSVCSSNEKQLGLAVMMYLQDYDDMFPNGSQAAVPYADNGAGWTQQVLPYLKANAVYLCPDDATGIGSSYMGNCAVFSPNRPLSKMTAPSRTVEMAEMSGFQFTLQDTYEYDVSVSWNGLAYDFQEDGQNNMWGGVGTSLIETGWLNGATYTSTTPKVGIHSGGSNFLLADGHVKWMMPDTVSPGYSAATPTSAQVSGAWGTAAGTSIGTYAATFSRI